MALTTRNLSPILFSQEIMVTVKTAINTHLHNCDKGTSIFSGLDKQLIAVTNLIVPNVLVSFADLDIKATGGAVHAFVQPTAKEALRRAIDERGLTIEVNSAYRTIVQQLFLFRRFKAGNLCGIVAAARPPLSNHQDGMALDIQDASGWESYLERHGWQRLGPRDPMHFDFKARGTRDDLGTIAVKAFQRLWNLNNPDELLVEDGIFGAVTEARLAASPIDGFPKVPQGINGEGNNGTRILRLNETYPPFLEGNDVRELQQLLNKADIDIDVAVDGSFGEETEKAVRRFQEKRGLSADGMVGSATWKELKR